MVVKTAKALSRETKQAWQFLGRWIGSRRFQAWSFQILVISSSIMSVLAPGNHVDSMSPEYPVSCLDLQASQWLVHDSLDCLRSYC